MILSNPRILLALEGAAVLAFASWSYAATGAGWGLFALLFFAPDLLMLGYLANPQIGSACYNLAHTEVLPILLLILAGPAVAPYAWIWLAHIGFDRMAGYGLKYPTFFKDTHLQRVAG